MSISRSIFHGIGLQVVCSGLFFGSSLSCLEGIREGSSVKFRTNEIVVLK